MRLAVYSRQAAGRIMFVNALEGAHAVRMQAQRRQREQRMQKGLLPGGDSLAQASGAGGFFPLADLARHIRRRCARPARIGKDMRVAEAQGGDKLQALLHMSVRFPGKARKHIRAQAHHGPEGAQPS